MSLHPFKRCCRCEHWDTRGSSETVGRCMRSSPSGGMGTFNMVSPDDGCGDWEISREILDELSRSFDKAAELQFALNSWQSGEPK